MVSNITLGLQYNRRLNTQIYHNQVQNVKSNCNLNSLTLLKKCKKNYNSNDVTSNTLFSNLSINKYFSKVTKFVTFRKDFSTAWMNLDIYSSISIKKIWRIRSELF